VRDPVNNPGARAGIPGPLYPSGGHCQQPHQALKDGMVTFTYKNRKKDRTEALTITAVEFIRRFLLHSLPKRFVRIRHYGFLANRNRSANLAAIRRLMALPEPSEPPVATVEGILRQLTGIDITSAPAAGKEKCICSERSPREWHGHLTRYFTRLHSQMDGRSNRFLMNPQVNCGLIHTNSL
jgi:hypothetical protein